MFLAEIAFTTFLNYAIITYIRGATNWNNLEFAKTAIFPEFMLL